MIPVIPISLHIFHAEKLESYCQLLKDKYGFESAMRWEDGKIHSIPQDYADMFGWDELANIVFKTYNQLSDIEKDNCFIYCQNYGEAGAIDYYGSSWGLPKVISFSDNYILWAPDSITQDIGILVNVEEKRITDYFAECRNTGIILNKYARESGVRIYLVKNPNEKFHLKYNEVKNKKAKAKVKPKYKL